jgi:hypothetical protein
MRITEERQIGSSTYKVQQLELNKALPLIPIVLRAVGPTLASLLDGSKSVEELLDGKVGTVTDAVREFSRSLEAHDLLELSNTLMTGSQLMNAETGTWIPLSSVAQNHFPPRYNEWLQWLFVAVGVNFASFLGGLENVRSALAAIRKAQQSPSPTESTGSSGGS